MRIIAVDPAPAKASTLYDGEYHTLAARDLNDYIRQLSSDGSCLVCWDAPLTGPWNPLVPGIGEHDFSQRPIERFFSRSTTGFKVPKGISVMPYSSCPHWAISRAILGLPQVGPWDSPISELPLKPKLDGQAPNDDRAYAVEIHPGIALWLWCREESLRSWAYKTDPEGFTAFCGAFLADLWEQICQDFDKDGFASFTARDISVHTTMIRDFPTILVVMPKAHFTTEAHMVCIVLKVPIGEIKERPDNPEVRYFTLEKGTDFETGSDRTVLCAWHGESHLNYGDGPEATPASFVAKVEEII